ncbi:MAG TPA: DUF5335 family protein [Pyrinomonadaceae bacterium]|nr:DUF5335 family protein [Pyrinomonadaceae bacterium]
MQTRIIPRDEWVEFFESFSREHEGSLVTLEVPSHQKVVTARLADYVEAEHLAFGGVTAELNVDGEDRIEVMVGEKAADHVTHNVAAPTEVSLDRTDDGADMALRIKASDETVTVLRILSPMLPEMVDGIVAESRV